MRAVNDAAAERIEITETWCDGRVCESGEIIPRFEDQMAVRTAQKRSAWYLKGPGFESGLSSMHDARPLSHALGVLNDAQIPLRLRP